LGLPSRPNREGPG